VPSHSGGTRIPLLVGREGGPYRLNDAANFTEFENNGFIDSEYQLEGFWEKLRVERRDKCARAVPYFQDIHCRERANCFPEGETAHA
jgi:hypothetical protein